MRNIIVGTAGHIDHGKTALVKALTGTDADRLEEEKRRGITIDIGFAHLQLTPGIRLGFVDVPGHERFIKNMLAGAGGIDLVAFVVAADESIKPQTREHFEICRLLGIRAGVIVLTKADLVDSDILDLVRLEVEEFVAGSFLDGAPVVPVSSVTGAGMDELRDALRAVAEKSAQKDAAGLVRLPVDRSFTAKGFGTIVTGTLISGTVAREQELELYPTGRRLRIRNVQVYGSAADRATAGQRTALNLADIEPGEITRGMVLAEPGRFRAVRQLDSVIELLHSAKPLRNRAPVRFHSGTAETLAEIRRLGDDRSPLQPGERAHVRIVLREPALLLPGDRFILRMFSPVTTIGGGTLLDTGAVRYKTRDSVAERFAILDGPDLSAKVALLVKESKTGLGLAELAARTGLRDQQILNAAESVHVLQPGLWLVDRDWWRGAKRRMLESVRSFHEHNPLLPGIKRESLDAPAALLDHLLRASPELAAEGDIVRLRTHRVVLKEDEEKARAAIEGAFAAAGLAVPALGDVLAASGVEDKRARSLLQSLMREKRLVRIADDLVFHHSAIERLRAMLAARKAERFNVGSFKEWTGVSRKYAIPLLEFLDRERLTRRDGNERVVL